MIIYNNFEWDVREAATSLATQGVGFKEASTVFAAENVVISEGPIRGQFCAVGTSARGRVIEVLHVRGIRIRILNACVEGRGATAFAVGRGLRGATADPLAAPESSREPDTSAQPSSAPPSAASPAAASPAAAPSGPRPLRGRIVPLRSQSTAPPAPVAAPAAPAAPAAVVAPAAPVSRPAATSSKPAAPEKAPKPAAPTEKASKPAAPAASASKPATASKPTTKAAASKPAAAPVVRTPAAAAPVVPTPAPAPAEPEAAAPASADSQSSGTGWTAEAYGIYWEAYSAARQAAREEGKSLREAQRIGREAGERAARGDTQPAPKKPAARSGSWRAAARAMKAVS